MGCSASGVDYDGKMTIELNVPNMPREGGPAEVKTPDGVTLQFFAPAGYGPDTQITTRYTPAPKPKSPPKTKAKAKAKAKAEVGKPLAENRSPAVESAGVPPQLSDSPASPSEPSAPSPKPQQVDVRIIYPLDKGMPKLPTQLPKMDGSWEWLRLANDEVHRVTRKDAGLLLSEAFRRGGYCVQQGTAPGQIVRFAGLSKMRSGTRILSFSQGLPKLRKDPQFKMELEYGQGITPIEKVQMMALKGGFKPASVNAASAYHAGGGFDSGGRHALEEAFCSQSTLLVSLNAAKELWTAGERQGKYTNEMTGYWQHIPTDGCILSPNVEIFRGNTDQGYLVHTKAVPVTAVVSVAMYNKNRSVRDAPVDAPSDPKAYEEGVRKKFAAMLHAAALAGADSIVIPDVGCGVFQNDPILCGRILGEVLFNYSSYFKRAVFTGKKEFYENAAEALKAASKSGILPITADVAKRSCITPLDAEAHLFVRNCVVCKRGLAGADFSDLGILIDKTNKSQQMQFLHHDCMSAAYKAFPKDQPMKLPDITRNVASFLKALDLSGDGYVEKQELKCVASLLWNGDVAKDKVKFDKDFDALFQSWDADQSGNVDRDQITGRVNSRAAPKAQATPQPQVERRRSFELDNLPKSCLQWFQDQSKKCK